MNFISKRLKTSDQAFLLADFAAGEHDRIPTFFLHLLPSRIGVECQVIVYSIDVHPLRLDSLLSSLESLSYGSHVRAVEAKLENMDIDARMRPQSISMIDAEENVTPLDREIIEAQRIPHHSFDLGILNNDIVGYLLDYYSQSSDLDLALRQIHSSMKRNGMLVVTAPSQMKRVDNVQLLHDAGFKFLEWIDVDLLTGNVTVFKDAPHPEGLSRVGHFSALMLGC